MSGEKDLAQILKTLKPEHQPGDYVFCVVEDAGLLPPGQIISLFREKEGITVIIRKELADQYQIPYSFIAAWITLTVHSSLEAVGLTAAFSTALAKEQISCNVVAAYYHDHIFVAQQDLDRAMAVLLKLSE